MPHTILLADDSVTIRRVVELAFQDTDIHVDAVGSGSEAMDRLAASPPDLVLADVVLPSPSGYDLCHAIKNSDRPVPVLLLRGAFEPFDERRASVCGADGSVVKPFEAERLVARVRTLLDRAGTTTGPADGGGPVEEAEAALDEIVDASRVESRPPEPGPVSSDDTAETVPAVGDPPVSLPVEVVAAPTPPEPTPIVAAPTVIPTDAPAESPTTVPVRVVAPARPDPGPAADGPDPDLVAAVADEVVRRLSDRVIREIAWEVVPDLAAVLIRQRLREIEREDPEDR